MRISVYLTEKETQAFIDYQNWIGEITGVKPPLSKVVKDLVLGELAKRKK